MKTTFTALSALLSVSATAFAGNHLPDGYRVTKELQGTTAFFEVHKLTILRKGKLDPGNGAGYVRLVAELEATVEGNICVGDGVVSKWSNYGKYERDREAGTETINKKLELAIVGDAINGVDGCTQEGVYSRVKIPFEISVMVGSKSHSSYQRGIRNVYIPIGYGFSGEEQKKVRLTFVYEYGKDWIIKASNGVRISH